MSQKNSGYSMIEVLFAVAILAILALGSASLAKLFSDSNRYADRKNAQSALAQLTIENLRHANSCDKAMGPSSGLSLLVNDTLIRQPGSSGGWPLTLKISSLNSGPTMTGNTIANGTILPLKRLRVDELKLADAVEVNLNATERTYVASVYLQTSEIGGISHRPILAGTVTLRTALATGAVIACETADSAGIQNTCAQMGCTYNSSLTPACRCNRTQVVCAAPGFMPVAFTADGLPDCRPIGGDVQCPAGEYLIGVGIDWHKCGPAPTAVAAGPAPLCIGGASTTVSPVAAAPSGCYCNSSQVWDGSNCVTAVAPVCLLFNSSFDSQCSSGIGVGSIPCASAGGAGTGPYCRDLSFVDKLSVASNAVCHCSGSALGGVTMALSGCGPGSGDGYCPGISALTCAIHSGPGLTCTWVP